MFISAYPINKRVVYRESKQGSFIERRVSHCCRESCSVHGFSRVVALGRWVGAYRTPPDQGGIGIGQVVPRGRLNLVVRDLSIREIALHSGYFLFLFSVGVCSCYLVFVSIPYNSHTDRRGHPEIRVVELFITEEHQTKYPMMMKKGRRKESTGRRITKRTQRV